MNPTTKEKPMNKINQLKLAVAVSVPAFVMVKSAIDIAKLTHSHKHKNDAFLIELREDQDKIEQMIINNDLRAKGLIIDSE